MLGLKRRTRVEGWALDVSEGEEIGYKSTLQRLGENNKLWVGTLLAVILIAFVVMHQSKELSASKKDQLYRPPAAPRTGAYRDQEHRDFAAEVVRDKAKPGTVIEARFMDDRKLRLVVAGDVSADEIEYLSWMSAQRALTTFKHRIVVQTYQRSATDGGDVLRSTTDWDVSRHGFVVTFIQKGK